MNTTKEHIEQLQKLLSRNIDSVKGFKKLAEVSESKRLETFFHMNILERESFISNLGQRIQQLGGSPQDESNFDAYLHRKWIDTKLVLSSPSEESIIEECLRGESKMISDYMEVASSKKIDQNSLKLISSQLESIQQHTALLEPK